MKAAHSTCRDNNVRCYSAESFLSDLVVHSRDDVRQSHDCVQNVLTDISCIYFCVECYECYPRHGEVVIITPVERHWSGHVSQGILGHLVRPMMLEVGLVLAPVVGVKAVVLMFLLGVVKDGVGAGPGRSVVEYVGQESFVHLDSVKH